MNIVCLSGVVLTLLLNIFNCSVYEKKRNITEHNYFIHAVPSSSCAGASFSALTKAAHANNSSTDRVSSFISVSSLFQCENNYYKLLFNN